MLYRITKGIYLFCGKFSQVHFHQSLKSVNIWLSYC